VLIVSMIWFTTACVMIEDGEVGVSKSFGAIRDEPLPTRVAFVARLCLAGIDPGVGLDEPGQVHRRCAGPQPRCSRTERRVKCASLRSIPWARALSLTILS
jgi:hypothetical protein